MLDAAAGVTGTSPSTRQRHGMTAVGTDIYLFGGYVVKGSIQTSVGELLRSDLPLVHSWPSFGLSSFTRIYDNDIIRVTEGVEWD